MAGLQQRQVEALHQQRPQPQPAQGDEGGVADRRVGHHAGRLRQRKQAQQAAQRVQRGGARRAGVGRAGRLVHAPGDHQPHQHRQPGQHAEAPAPVAALDQPGQRAGGGQHAQAAQAHGQARHGGKALGREMPADEHRAHQKRRRAAGADQRLPQQQHAEAVGLRRQQRPRHGHRKRQQDGAAHAPQVQRHAHGQLHGAEREVKRRRPQPQLLRTELQLRRQRRPHDGAQGAKRLTEHEGAGQRQQHGPGLTGGKRRRRGVRVRSRRHQASGPGAAPPAGARRHATLVICLIGLQRLSGKRQQLCIQELCGQW